MAKPKVARLKRAIAIAGAVACVTISLIYLIPLLRDGAVLPDYTIFWTAARFALRSPELLYDTNALTEAQAWAVSPGRGPRPFSYPPSSLLLFAPFGLLPFWVAYWTWIGTGALAFWSAVRRLASGWAVPLSMSAPHVMLCLILGQTSLFTGALIIWAVTLIRERPVLAGFILGLAAALKPQSVLLAPIALVSGHHWKTLAGAGFAFLACAVLSLAFGPQLWMDWWIAVREFPEEVLTSHRLFYYGATPWMLGRTLGFDPLSLLTLQIGSIAAGVTAVWFAFKSDDPGLRMSALVIGGMLASPYAMRYDLAALTPVLATALLSGTVRGLLVSIPLFALNSLAIVPAIIVSLSAQFLRQIQDRKGVEELSG